MTKDVDTPTSAVASARPREARRGEIGARVEQIGRVEEVEDGVASVSGLPDVGLDELLRFDKGQFGFARRSNAIASAACCSTTSPQSPRATSSTAPATWPECRSARAAWARRRPLGRSDRRPRSGCRGDPCRGRAAGLYTTPSEGGRSGRGVAK